MGNTLNYIPAICDKCKQPKFVSHFILLEKRFVEQGENFYHGWFAPQKNIIYVMNV